MSKIGRNQPCPCGSGKKFKRCHGSSENKPVPSTSSPLNPTSEKQPRADLGFPGLPGAHQHLLMRAYFSDPNDPRNLGGPEGMPGQYKVIFTLNRPGFALAAENHFLPASNLTGDSHLAIAKPALTFLDGREFDKLYFGCNTPNGRFGFYGLPNEKGFLAKIESDLFDAAHFSDAALKAHQAMMPVLSGMSVYWDVPVNVYQMDVTEVRTGSLRISIRMPFREVPGGMPPIELSEEHQKYASLYREALNSNSSNYQFLCLYRIIEGLRERRQRIRSEAAREAKQKGESPPIYPEEKIPSTRSQQREFLNSVFPQPRRWSDEALALVFIEKSVDRRIGNLIHKGEELHNLRNQIAHAVLDSGEGVISIDKGLDIDKVEAWLPLTKLLARYLLKEAFPDMFTAG